MTMLPGFMGGLQKSNNNISLKMLLGTSGDMDDRTCLNLRRLIPLHFNVFPLIYLDLGTVRCKTHVYPLRDELGEILTLG